MYKAIYRKYRPLNFEDLLGQDHITKVLKNQINTNSISHAYLFSGTRGTGKTSCAKIFARAVNCESSTLDKPCNKCDSCLESLDDSSIDIIEIDAASNNGVDNIRDLKDRAFYQPTSLKYKVYIIDEVHMLSKGAFNALLKILEEPPEHLIFILATTEPERIPLTILSRCQKFQFRRITSMEIENSLRKIAKAENVNLDDKSYQLIVSSCDGSMRDAQSLLEQLLTAGKEDIDYDFATGILGIVNSSDLFKIVDTIIDNEPGELLEILDDTLNSGKDVEQLGKDILDHFRNLMISKAAPDSMEKLVYSNTKEYIDQSKRMELNQILVSMEKLIEQINAIKYSKQKRALLEITLLEIISTIHSNIYNINTSPREVKSEAKREVKEKISIERPIETTIEKPRVEEIPKKNSKPIINNTNEKVEKVDVEENTNSSNSNITTQRVKDDWKEILLDIKNSPKKLIHALVIEASIVSFENNLLTLGFHKDYSFHRDSLMKKENLEPLEKVIGMFYNEVVKINAVFIDSEDNSIDSDIETLTNLVGEKNIKIF